MRREIHGRTQALRGAVGRHEHGHRTTGIPRRAPKKEGNNGGFDKALSARSYREKSWDDNAHRNLRGTRGHPIIRRPRHETASRASLVLVERNATTTTPIAIFAAHGASHHQTPTDGTILYFTRKASLGSYTERSTTASIFTLGTEAHTARAARGGPQSEAAGLRRHDAADAAHRCERVRVAVVCVCARACVWCSARAMERRACVCTFV